MQSTRASYLYLRPAAKFKVNPHSISRKSLTALFCTNHPNSEETNHIKNPYVDPAN